MISTSWFSSVSFVHCHSVRNMCVPARESSGELSPMFPVSEGLLFNTDKFKQTTQKPRGH